MAIAEQVLTLLGKPLWGHVGTRSAELVPDGHLTWGLRVTADRAHVEVLVPALFVGSLRANLADNGSIALTVAESKTHEAYQLKGRSVEIRESTEEDRAFQREWGERNCAYVRAIGFPEHLVAKLDYVWMAPSTYVRFRVDEHYVQTPGPMAGNPIPFED